MPRLIYALLACLLTALAPAADVGASDDAGAAASPSNDTSAPDSEQMEKDLQRLPWQEFKTIIESVPKLKSDVDAYGPFGWQYVQSNYATYRWRKSIDRLDDTQKRRLAELIETVRGDR